MSNTLLEQIISDTTALIHRIDQYIEDKMLTQGNLEIGD